MVTNALYVYVWMLLLQFLAKKHARGKVVSYRVNATCPTFTDEREFPPGPGGCVTSALQLDLPVNSSCTIGLDAATERGYNDSLQPASVVIPAYHDGQLLPCHCSSGLVPFI